MKKILFFVLFCIVLLGVGFWFWGDQRPKYIYIGSRGKVAGGGGITRINLSNNKSKQLKLLKAVERPYSLMLDDKKERLYIVGKGEGIDIINLKKSNRHIGAIKLEGLIRDGILSPTGKILYVINPDRDKKNEPWTLAIDTKSGEVIGDISIPLSNRYFAFGTKNTELVKMTLNEKSIYSLKNDTWIQQISFKTKKNIKNHGGIQPPGRKLKYPYMKIKNSKLNFYNRENGNLKAEIPLQKSAGGYVTANQFEPVVVNKRKAYIPAVIRTRKNGQIKHSGYVLIVDINNKKLIKKIKVGGIAVTNMVVYNE